MAHVPVLSERQMQRLQQVVGANHTLDLTVNPKSKSRRLPSYESEVETSGGGVVLAKINSGSASTGYVVTLYANGRNNASTGTGVVFLPEVALMASLPAGTWVLAHLTEVVITGGND